MPASGRLLQKLNETWGEEVTQDLVTWVTEAQTVNRAELRELNERMTASEVSLAERVAASEARLTERIAASAAGLNERIALSEARFEAKLNERIGVWEAKLEAKLDERINAVRLEVARLEGRFDTDLAGVNGRVDAGVGGLGGRLDASVAGLRAELASQMRDQMKWMFVFWIGTLVPLAGLIVALGKAWL